MSSKGTIGDSLAARFADASGDMPAGLGDNPGLSALAGRGSCRAFTPDPVDPQLLRALCALSLCAPSKSDLQQRDIVIVADPQLRGRINGLLAEQAWIADAPSLLVFCGNNRRQRLLHDWRGHGFANDHLDAFFNAAVDAGIALATFVTAAEAAGLGCCPISAIRNRAGEVADALALPDHVFPVAALGLGWPAERAQISPRLPLAVTVHTDRYDDTDLRDAVDSYDRSRAARQPYGKQRGAVEFGLAEDYGWSEDKARQYARPERADFGEYVRRIGFDLS